MTPPGQKRENVFISYSHKDVKWLQRLRVHLRPLEREHRIEIWDDTRIIPGSKWKEEIERGLSSSKVAVLLVSADFLASDFIAADELPPLLDAAEKEGVIILPLLLSPSRFLRTKLSHFQAVNSPSELIINMSKGEQEAVLVKLTEIIEASLVHSPTTEPIEQPQGDIRNDDSQILKPNPAAGSELKREVTANVSENRTPFPFRLNRIWLVLILGVVAFATVYWLTKPKEPVNVPVDVQNGTPTPSASVPKSDGGESNKNVNNTSTQSENANANTSGTPRTNSSPSPNRNTRNQNDINKKLRDIMNKNQ